MRGFFSNCRRVAVVTAVILAAPQAALAHAAMVKSDPAARAVLRQPPTQIRLWFNEPIEVAYSTVTLTDQADKKIVPTGPAAVDSGDNKLLVLPLQPLPPGVYAVNARVLSRDGDVVNFHFTFTVKQPPPTANK
jgi:methionine-rich copper-binding protein CopC